MIEVSTSWAIDLKEQVAVRRGPLLFQLKSTESLPLFNSEYFNLAVIQQIISKKVSKNVLKPLCSWISSPLKKACLLQMLGLLTGTAVAAAVWVCVCVLPSNLVHWLWISPPTLHLHRAWLLSFYTAAIDSAWYWSLVEKQLQSLFLKIFGC